MAEALIEFNDVSKHFGTLKVLDEINLAIHQGEITTVIGKSGAGKSVILKHIAGLLNPDSGEILYRGQNLAKLKRREKKQMKARFGYMFQNVALFDSMTAYDNIALPLREKTKLREEEVHKKVMDRMEQLEIAHVDKTYPSQLSGGMKKRVGLARVLVTEPEIILFDEPTTGLDPIRKNAVHSMISQMQNKLNFTAVMVSHEIPDIFYFSQKVAMLDEGHIVVEGPPEMIEKSEHPAVKQFIKGVESLKDELTGLDNKTAIFEKFKIERSRSKQYHSIFASVVFKIDNLRKINEQLGYSVGQKLFKDFSAMMNTFLRASDQKAKYEDDMIVLILPGTSAKGAWKVAHKFGAIFRDRPLFHSEGQPPITYSISAAAVQASNEDRLEDLIAKGQKRLSVISYVES